MLISAPGIAPPVPPAVDRQVATNIDDAAAGNIELAT